MGVSFVAGLRACVVALGLVLAAVHAAEAISPLVGLTRDQLLLRLGEPRNLLESGNRTVFLYPRARIVLRNDVVVEVEEFAVEPDAPSPPPSQVPPTTASEQSSEVTVQDARPAATPAPPPEAKIEIKLVRPPAGKEKREPAAAPARPPAPKQSPPESEQAQAASPEPESRPGAPAANEPQPREAVAPPNDRSPSARQEAPVEQRVEGKAQPAPARPVRTEASPAPVRTEDTTTQAPAEAVVSMRVYVIAFAIIAGGIVLLFWRIRQRQLELAASSVESTPVVTAATPLFTGTSFTADALARMDAKRFEELVAAYYNKTGVVALRTSAGPSSPVHIRIAWKGESRPFAYVQCIADPAGVVDPKPLQALVNALAADDIRRGYVVTSGRFNTAARDFAAEKHLTLLPGETFLEKLNALPTSARTEIMRTVAAVDPGAT